MSVMTPISKTDPYEPEKSNEAPVKLRFTFRNGHVLEKLDGHRVMTTPAIPIKLHGSLFLFRGVDDAGARLYYETPVLDCDGLSVLQAEYVALTEQIDKSVWEKAFHGDRAGTKHGAALVRRQAIAFHLVDAEIARIQNR